MVLCFGFQEPKITGIFKITCLANHIRDGFRKQQMTLVKLSIIELTILMIETIFQHIVRMTVH